MANVKWRRLGNQDHTNSFWMTHIHMFTDKIMKYNKNSKQI